MTQPRIVLSNVSVRFRMSYHRVHSIPGILAETKDRLFRRWSPDYFTALDGVDLKISSGDVIGVIGRNGAGKSTLLRTICGIYSPDTGSVSVSGRVSALLQLGTGFNNSLSGRENIILGGLILGYTLEEIQDRMDMIASFAELDEFIDVPTRYYSSGMMARLSFSMVVSLEPDILLIDETLSVGDLAFQEKSKAVMHELLKKANCQVIVSHSLTTLQNLCNRLVLIDHGKVVCEGEPAKVIDEYEQLVGASAKDNEQSAVDLLE